MTEEQEVFRKKLEDEYNVGQKIFKELFQLSDDNLKKKILEILEGDDDEILNNSDCIRTIKNEEPQKIKFRYYSGLEIDWSGIIFHPEHGQPNRLVKFNKFFNLGYE